MNIRRDRFKIIITNKEIFFDWKKQIYPVKWLEPNIMNSIITIFFFSDTLNLTFIGY